MEDYISELEKRKTIEGELDDLDQARLDAANAVLKIQQDINSTKQKETLAQLQLNQAEADAAKDKEKKAEEAFKKEKERQDAIKKIIDDANKDAVEAAKDLEFKKREIAAEDIKNTEEREKEKAKISGDRILFQIEQERKKAEEDLKLKKASQQREKN